MSGGMFYKILCAKIKFHLLSGSKQKLVSKTQMSHFHPFSITTVKHEGDSSTFVRYKKSSATRDIWPARVTSRFCVSLVPHMAGRINCTNHIDMLNSSSKEEWKTISSDVDLLVWAITEETLPVTQRLEESHLMKYDRLVVCSYVTAEHRVLRLLCLSNGMENGVQILNGCSCYLNKDTSAVKTHIWCINLRFLSLRLFKTRCQQFDMSAE